MDPTNDKEFQAALLKLQDPVQTYREQLLFWRTLAFVGWALVVILTVTLSKS